MADVFMLGSDLLPCLFYTLQLIEHRLEMLISQLYFITDNIKINKIIFTLIWPKAKVIFMYPLLWESVRPKCNS